MVCDLRSEHTIANDKIHNVIEEFAICSKKLDKTLNVFFFLCAPDINAKVKFSFFEKQKSYGYSCGVLAKDPHAKYLYPNLVQLNVR